MSRLDNVIKDVKAVRNRPIESIAWILDDNGNIKEDVIIGDVLEYLEELYEHTPKEMAEQLMGFIRDFSDNEEYIETEKMYVAELFDKLQKSEEFNVLAHYLDTMFMDKVFNTMEKLFKISELSKDMQEKIYNKYIKESGMTKEEISIADFIDYSNTYLGNVYTIDGKFIDELNN